MSQRGPNKRVEDTALLTAAPESETGSFASALTPPTLSAKPSPAALLMALQRRWLLALVLGVGGAIGAAAAAWTFLPAAKYQVAAMVHISATPTKGPFGPAAFEGENFAFLQKTQMTLVKSQIVLTTALKNPEVASLPEVRRSPSPRQWLYEQIEIDFKQGPEILRISMKGEDADGMALLINAVMQAYLDEFFHAEESRRSIRLKQLEDLQELHRRSLAEKRKKLATYATKLGGGDPLVAGGLQLDTSRRIAQAQDDLQATQGERGKFERQLRAQESRAKGNLESLVSPALVEQELDNDVLVKTHLDTVIKLEVAVDGIQRKAANPEAAEAQLRESGSLQALKAAQGALESRRKKLRPAVLERLRANALAACEAEIARIREEIRVRDGEEKRIQTFLANLRRDSISVGEQALEMKLASRAVDAEEAIVTTLEKEIEALRLHTLSPPRAKVLDRAVASSSNDGKKRILMTGAAGGGTLTLVLLGIAWWEFRKRKLESADEVICGFGINLVGTLPALPRRALRRLPATQPPGTPGRWAEAIDSFRTILLRGGPAGKFRVVMVTSAMPGEGKTSLSCHLAVSLARSGRKTLLVDGDMRNPNAHRMFGLLRAPGLSEILRGKLDPLAAVQETTVPGLSIIPAGEFALAAVHCLGGGNLKAIFEQLGQHFDTVLVDSCPILPVADTLHLAQHVDGVIFSVLRRVSRLPKVSAALHRLRQVGAPILGAVVNGTDEDVYGSRYYTEVAPQG